MSVLSARQLSKSYGPQTLFELLRTPAFRDRAIMRSLSERDSVRGAVFIEKSSSGGDRLP